MKAVPSPVTSVAFTGMRDAVISKGHSRVNASLRLALAISVLAVMSAKADIITTNDIVPIPQRVAGSGNGTIENRMFTYSGAEIPNSAGLLFNGDNGNNTLPQGGGGDTMFFNESFVTTAGELKAFYNLNFLPGTISELVLFLDLNETSGGAAINTLGKLDIILNPTTIQGNPNPFGDVSSVSQAAINQVYTGGTLLSSLNPYPVNLAVNSQGAGFADYAIFTGINPFSLNDSDVILFNISMSELSNGAEEIFLSGTYAASDIIPVPEPGCLALLLTGGLGLAIARRRSR
ncbi:MAG TPA: PEP-CTERM sorting domain-containing protein [Verrucomicrobiae bacterium]|nr:PEP-CTERM sorting domain-containing protein [Verrucomicrobiae bacterium]